MYPLTAGLIVESKELRDEIHSALDPLPIRLLFELADVPTEMSAFLDRIQRMSPDVVLLDTTRLQNEGRLEAVIKAIRATSGRPVVFALHAVAEPGAILAAMRAGASEFLNPPVAEALAAGLDRASEQRQERREKKSHRAKVLGFVSAKGGCGATSIACHVAASLPAETNGKVLLADLDLQSGMVNFLLKTHSPYSIADAVNNLQRMDPSYWQGLLSNGIPNLEIITAPTAPAAKQISPAHLKQVVAFARTQYDWLVADLGRNVNTTTLALLDVVDETFLVITQDLPALHQAKQMIHGLLEAGYASAQLKLILNRTSGRFEVTLEELETMLGLPIFATIEDDPNGFQDALGEGRLLDGSRGAGQDLQRLTRKIAGVTEPPKRKKFSLFG